MAPIQSKPSSELPPRAERSGVADGGGQRGRSDEAGSGNGLQSPAASIRVMPGQELDLDLADLDAQGVDHLGNQEQRPTC